jgi:hypothetical protein
MTENFCGEIGSGNSDPTTAYHQTLSQPSPTLSSWVPPEVESIKWNLRKPPGRSHDGKYGSMLVDNRRSGESCLFIAMAL